MGSDDDPLELGEKRKTSHRARSGELRGCSNMAMFFLVRTYRIFRPFWAGALWWWSSHDVSYHNSRLSSCSEGSIGRRLYLLTVSLSGLVANSHCGWYSSDRRTWSTWLNSDCLVFFGLGDAGNFPKLLWRLVSRLHSKAFVWSPVMTQRNKNGLVRRSMMSWHTCMQCALSFSNFGTIFAKTFCILKFSAIISQTLFFFMSSWLKIIQTVNRQPPDITNLIYSTLTSVLLVESLLLLEPSFISSRLSLNPLSHWKRRVHDSGWSPYTC